MTDSHKPRKRFGQNFLHDPTIIKRIIDAISPKPEDLLIEIGPGLGAITLPLLQHVDKLTVVELDKDLVARLQTQFPEPSPLTIISGDALKVDYSAFAVDGAPIRLIGNLPYNISTPLIFHLLTFKDYIADMHFMLQKEVVDRLASPVNEKSYGRLSVMTQYHCDIHSLIAVPPGAFNPPPKVQSAIVRLTPKPPSVVADNYPLLEQIVALCFQQRRKTLRNTLKPWRDQLNDVEQQIDLNRRPETLSVDEFVAISNSINGYL